MKAHTVTRTQVASIQVMARNRDEAIEKAAMAREGKWHVDHVDYEHLWHDEEPEVRDDPRR
jgi:hypothetical protein